MRKSIGIFSGRLMRIPLVLFGALLLLWRSDAVGQLGTTDRKGTVSVPDILQMAPELQKKEVTPVTGKEVSLDAPVNPADYYVGPGDLLSLNIWSSSPVQNELTVTPEGTLLIPSVGSVSARDLTLEALKTNVTNLVNRKYPRSEVTLTLISSRKVSVQIVGQVLNEGTYEMRSVQRVSDLILKANELIGGQTIKDYYEKILVATRLKREASDRKILLKHRDGSIEHVDLLKYRLTYSAKCNPYLREGDIAYVPERGDLKNSIAVFGGANKFGSFEFIPGDSLKDLIMMGFGVKPAADSGHVRFSRLSRDGSRMEDSTINLSAVIEGRVGNIALAPGDRIFIPERRDSRANYYVAVEGEVAQPGHYPITKNSTRLSELVRSAGGFTPDAFLRGAKLIRLGASQPELEDKAAEEQLLSARSSNAPQDSGYYLAETALRLKGEPVAVDFYKLFVQGDTTQDVILQTYDKVVVPPRRGTVYVFGQVASPGHVPLLEGKDYHHYVEKAGGFTEEARKGDVKIIKGSTRNWLNPGETTIEDGDYIWVPKEIYYPFSYYLTTYAQIASIIGVAATVALVAITARK